MASKRLIIFSAFLCLICSNISTSKAAPEVDDTVVLKQSNFSEFVKENRFVMVEFCSPLSDVCHDLAPEYAAAAAELKDEAVALAKVDAIEEEEIAMKFDVRSVPTIIFIVDGVHHKPYRGELSKYAIVTWLKKMTSSGVQDITTAEDAERLLAEEEKIVLGYLGSFVGSDNEELSAASHMVDDVSFYQTTSADVLRLFHIDPSVKRPALVIIKKEPERVDHFGGQFTRTATAEFVFENKLPLVINITDGPSLHSFNKPLLGLVTTPRNTKKTYAILQKVSKILREKMICMHMEKDKEFDPIVVAHSRNFGDPVVKMPNDFTSKNVKPFAEKFLSKNHEQLFVENDDIKDVFGDNFEKVVLDESKDVLLQIYDPWSRPCQDLVPIYNNLAMNLRGVDSLVIARMDGRYEYLRAKGKDFPIIRFYPAGQESFYPIRFKGDPTLGNLYKFVKKHASIPFELIQWDVKDEL